MDKTERLNAHMATVPDGYRTDPESHLQWGRDNFHYEWTVEHLRAHNAKHVLDIGVWDGWLDFLLVKAGFTLEGTEIDPALCRAAETYARENEVQYKIHQGFLDDIVLDSKFDAVVCYEVLEHVAWEDVPRMIAKMHSLAPLLLIAVPDQDHMLNQPQHLWTPTREKIDLLFPGAAVEHYFFNGIPPNWLISHEWYS